MKKLHNISILMVLFLFLGLAETHAFLGGKFKLLKPENGKLIIPVNTVSDGKAHYFRAESEDGIMVDFFVVRSPDGVIRAAIDSCDVCFRSGKGYVQDGNVMICTNCGRRFATDRINDVKGGCNPAPLKRVVQGDSLVISIADINANAWYCRYK